MEKRENEVEQQQRHTVKKLSGRAARVLQPPNRATPSSARRVVICPSSSGKTMAKEDVLLLHTPRKGAAGECFLATPTPAKDFSRQGKESRDFSSPIGPSPMNLFQEQHDLCGIWRSSAKRVPLSASGLGKPRRILLQDEHHNEENHHTNTQMKKKPMTPTPRRCDWDKKSFSASGVAAARKEIETGALPLRRTLDLQD
ncbi:uncharacterized protein LOC9651384 [Selaginella moellendorffii]|uniref:uncharacterized protein LOC9651384 n=1 Tax=Selaginella moellendorffii TaxID=88036 RepID=UPI000D1C6D8D|nr:uncharacterized protein LOC9651384 [Selaginella moellendorffii]XP_024521655.1 uncharacterized protein LOC9651384 [Selaginella moellendorffii]|eukprot:XP_024521653.1 uncharacterized protein LOC9651384 [Selaginella moellendorffii]